MGGQFEGCDGPIQFREPTVWSISDDSQLTLATCESIIEVGRVDPEHIASRFLVWFRDRRITGMGASTLKALRDLDAGNHWALAGAKGEMSAGNGAAMRIAPLAFFLDPTDAHDRQVLRDVCRITHHNEEAYVGALAIMSAIRLLVFEYSSAPRRILQHIVAQLPDSRVRDRAVELTRLPSETSIAEVAARYGSSGYVVDSVPLALYAAQSIGELSLHAILRDVIEAGGDTDTIASMAGQVTASWIGASQIPSELVRPIDGAAQIEQIATKFALAVETVA
jgi:ADP-ribosylglycohydrolase